MGTAITLEVGGLTLDWCKNSRGHDHGMLFQEKDRKRIHSDQIDYDYFKKSDEDPGAMEMAFCKPLKEVVPRLELLGFTLDQLRCEYESCAANWSEECRATTDDGDEVGPDLMSFEEFCKFVTAHSIEALDDSFISPSDESSGKQIRGRFDDIKITGRLPSFPSAEINAYSEKSFFADLILFLHPYSCLRLLALNAANLDLDVVWQYGPLVDAGWANIDDFMHGARRKQTFLVATEGSSDAHILKHAFSLLRSEIADFFRFIDVSESHPFPGTGNLLKFAEGLIKIDVQNQIVFLFDNDGEGSEAYQKLIRRQLPSNIRAMMLPELEQFQTFPARGPEGVNNADINGRAAAIECYLDLNIKDYPPAKVVWTNYKKDLDLYHGSLEHKDSYTREFLKQTVGSVSAGNYRVDKLRVVLEAIVIECCTAAKEGRNTSAA